MRRHSLSRTHLYDEQWVDSCCICIFSGFRFFFFSLLNETTNKEEESLARSQLFLLSNTETNIALRSRIVISPNTVH